METIRSLKDTDFNLLYKAFSRAFEGYEMQVNKKEFTTMITRRGFKAELSFGAFINEQLVAFTLNGIGSFNGKKTAYDTGTGTIREFRGKGLATNIFNHSIPYLKSAGINQYLLEVLQHNDQAVSVYQNIGFEIAREFNYFVQQKAKIKFPEISSIPNLSCWPIDLSYISKMKSFFDFEPAWQNSFESIHRRMIDFQFIGAFCSDKLVGHCIFDPATGDITQIAVHPDFRRKGIGTVLLKKAVSRIPYHSIKIVNTEISSTSIVNFLAKHNIPLCGKQFEMLKAL